MNRKEAAKGLLFFKREDCRLGIPEDGAMGKLALAKILVFTQDKPPLILIQSHK